MNNLSEEEIKEIKDTISAFNKKINEYALKYKIRLDLNSYTLGDLEPIQYEIIAYIPERRIQ